MNEQVSKNIFWLTTSRALAVVLLAAAYFLLFRYLGPYFSGQYQFILSFVLIFSTIVDFGIQQFITKKISENPGETKSYFQEFFTFESWVAVFLYLVLITIAFLRGYEPAVFYGICLAGSGMVLNALCYPFMSVLAANQDLRKVALINFLNSLVNISVIFLAIFFHKHIVFLALIQPMFGVLDLALYRIFIKKYLPSPGVLKSIFRFDFHLIKNIIKQGWPFVLLVGFSAIYNRIDVILITQLLGFTQTGLYTAAYKIFDLLNFFPAAVSFTLFPFFTSLISKGLLGEVRTTLEKYLKLMLLLALPVAVGGMVLSGKLIALVAGREFLTAGQVLAVLIWAPAIQFVYIPFNSIVTSQLTKKAMVVTGANVLVNILGNLLLLPVYGIKAAAIMTVVSEAIQGVFYFYFVRVNVTAFSFLKFFIKPAFASLVMGLILWPLRSYNLALTLTFGALAYLLVLSLSGFLKKEDVKIIISLFKKSPAL